MTRSTAARLQRVLELFTSSLGALVLTALAFTASNAHAAPPSPNIALRYTHSALSSPEEAAKLYRSIKSAARRVCGIDGSRLALSEYQRAQRCYQQTLDDVVNQINQPQLTALHQSAGSKVGSAG